MSFKYFCNISKFASSIILVPRVEVRMIDYGVITAW
uniref:Uncharacterized protein n=1 Tax=Siphoviridae sp. ct2D011 TaxID=2825314 RepID=A0A8S5V9E7_9CAUD|nr:MAG TPA: hypothetical protein [Siphoviridae sp. ct2D011]